MQRRIRSRKDVVNPEKSKKRPVVEVLAIIGGLLGLIAAIIGLITALIYITPNIISFIKNNDDAPSIPFSSSTINILIPLYVYPDQNGITVWREVIDASKKAPITVIINPASGPGVPSSGAGSCPQSPYNSAILELLDNGIQTIGYVDTQQGKRDLNQVKADIDIYLNCYQVNGVFIEGKYATTKENLSYYYNLYWYTRHGTGEIDRAPQPLVFLGAGNNPSDEYYTQYYIEPAFDTAIIFEGASSPAWVDYSINDYVNKKNTEPPYTAALIHSTSSITTMQYNVKKAVERHINYVYVTDDVMDNPWDSLPTYWRSEVDYIYEINLNLQNTNP
jgi:hypothetical protein